MYVPPANHRSPSPGNLGEGNSLLEELDKFAPIKSFDAFPKVWNKRKFRMVIV
jgi:hypothetical protein